jgi:hypothetical protein
MFKNRKRLLLGLLAILAVIGIPAGVFLSQQQQETRSRASASTTLYFNPATTSSAPLQKTVGQPVSFDVMVSPGNNRPSFVKLEINYDATKLQPTSSPFVVNTVAFPTIQEGPILQSGKIFISVNVGNDPSKSISQITKVGTVNFTSTAITAPNTTIVSLGANSQILSTASGDQATENVLSSTTPAYVMIANIPTATPTPTPIPPTATPSPTPIRKAGDGGNAGKGGGSCGSLGSNGSIGSNTTGGTGGTGGTGCSGIGLNNAGGIGGTGGLGSSTGPGNPGQNGKAGTGTGAGGGGGGGGGGAPGQPGGRGGDGGPGCNGAPGQPGLPGEAAPNANTGGKGGAGGAGGPACTPTATPTPSPTNAPTTPPTLPPSSTKLALTVFMHGIGNSGDNANPTLFTLSNKNPLTPTRSVTVEVLNTASTMIATASGNVAYNNTTGNFKGVVDMGFKIPTSGTYKVKIKEKTHLRVLTPQDPTITLGQTATLPDVTLIAGDVNNDNALNILDYNLIIGCYSDLAPAPSCTASNKLLTDLNDNGSVNQFDYNLYLREIAVQNGQ